MLITSSGGILGSDGTVETLLAVEVGKYIALLVVGKGETECGKNVVR